MCKVVDEVNVVNDLFLLTLDSPPPNKPYWRYKIGGKVYDIVMVYDMGDKVISVHGPGNFVGDEVEFVA